MIRYLFLSLLALSLGASLFSADAQRVNRDEFSAMVEQLQQSDMEGRAATAEVGARITDLNAKNADLNGKVETLEFLLSQSRDQVNRMQEDDAELGKLIARLESRLNAQDQKIRDLESRLEASRRVTVTPGPDTATSTTNEGTGSATSATSSTDGVTRRVVTSQSAPSSASQTGTPQTGTPQTGTPQTGTPQTGTPQTGTSATTTSSTGQPTRITRTTRTTTTTSTPTTTRNSSGELSGGEALPQGTLGQLPASNLPGEAGPLFADAKSRLLRFDYEGAELAFRAFLDRFGDDPQAGEAQYWLAETLYQQEAYAESGQAYTDMIRTYPRDPRAPEALAKLARALRLVGDTEKACNALNLLPQRYPDASGLTKNLAAGERVRSGCDR